MIDSFYALRLTGPELLLWCITHLMPLLFLLALFAVRRKARLWRRLGAGDFHKLRYIGETTLFPTYRRRGTLVWVTSAEAMRPCYVREEYTCRYEKGRLTLAREADRRYRAQHQLHHAEPHEEASPAEEPAATHSAPKLHAVQNQAAA